MKDEELLAKFSMSPWNLQSEEIELKFYTPRY